MSDHDRHSMVIQPLKASALEGLARLLAECCTGSDITGVLARENIQDELGPTQTKWRRLHQAFVSSQYQYSCSNHVFAVIKAILDPVKFVNRQEYFETCRQHLNGILAFSGFEYGANGEFQRCKAAQTLTEAHRHSTIQEKLRGRNIHSRVLASCKSELMQDNYFHAVFEASKGLAEHIREKSGSKKDGASLVDDVFSKKKPVLAFSSMRTETEISEHVGFAALLKGCFAAIRNPHAHTPKIHWEGDDNAADYLTLISLLHRKIDSCRQVGSHSAA